ncbi:MAG TPA: alpha/beta hydrolase [Gemmataceae bacterium]|nr:alpha/beta hydrolase [Gemmataceae bacterium]
MMKFWKAWLSALCILVASNMPALAGTADDLPTHKEDIIYGRKFGTALTLDVFAPKHSSNGAAVVLAVSGGWVSAHEAIGAPFFKDFIPELTRRGYTVFAVVHGSQPRFTIPEILEDMHRAVRYIRYNARVYDIDPKRLGITGGSAGGHLSLMQGMAGRDGDPKAPDPVNRVSSRVQAVACFFPPTDFLNYGKPGEVALGTGILKGFKAPFDFNELDKKTNSFVVITDQARRQEIGRQISPVYHVGKSSPPTLIIHGDADKLVPIQQAQLIIEKLKAASVPAELVVKPGAKHGWDGLVEDMPTIADWFDKYLKKPAK